MPKSMRQSRPWLRAFWNRAYRENVTGLSAMVAYNLMLAVFPFALLVLFVGGQVLKIEGGRGKRPRRPQAALPQRRASRRSLTCSAGSRKTPPRSGSPPSSARSGLAPHSGARWTPPSAASTTSSAVAGSSRSASPSRCSPSSCSSSLRQHLSCPAMEQQPGLEHRPAPPFGLSDIQGESTRGLCCSVPRSSPSSRSAA